jgi:hypothetical protein
MLEMVRFAVLLQRLAAAYPRSVRADQIPPMVNEVEMPFGSGRAEIALPASQAEAEMQMTHLTGHPMIQYRSYARRRYAVVTARGVVSDTE